MMQVNLDVWYVCPIKPSWEHTNSVYLDRTRGFLVKSNIKEITLAVAKSTEPNQSFTGEVIPYKEWIPGLSEKGMIDDIRRWVGYMNHPDDLPLGACIQMD